MGLGVVVIGLYPVLVSAETASVGFAGQVVSINGPNSFSAKVKSVYAQGGGKAGLVLVPGRALTVEIPSGTIMKDLRGNPITLDQVPVGALFNATGQLDTTTRVFTASSIAFTKMTTTGGTTTGGTNTGGTTTGGTTEETDKPSDNTTTDGTVDTNNVAENPPSSTRGGGFAGKIEQVNADSRQVTALVRTAYGGAQSRGFRVVVIPGRSVTMMVPSDAVILRLGAEIPLAAVTPGDLFNATVTLAADNTVIAKRIQIISSNISKFTYRGTITGVTAVSLAVKNSAGEERTFELMDKTLYWDERNPSDANVLAVGKQVVVVFYVQEARNIATRVNVVDEIVSELIRRVESAGKRSVRVLVSAQSRADKIIGKMEVQVDRLAGEGKDVTEINAALDVATANLAEARVRTSEAEKLFNAIAGSDNQEAAAKEARNVFRDATVMTKNVFKELRDISKKLVSLDAM